MKYTEQFLSVNETKYGDNNNSNTSIFTLERRASNGNISI